MIHGTASEYRRGCRCDACRQAKATAARIYYLRDPDMRRAAQHEYRVKHWAKILDAKMDQYHERRDAALIALGGKCVECGTTEALCFDHIDPTTKTLEVAGAFLGYSETVLQAELAKCQLLCVRCHGMKSARERGTMNA